VNPNALIAARQFQWRSSGPDDSGHGSPTPWTTLNGASTLALEQDLRLPFTVLLEIGALDSNANLPSKN